MKKVLVIVGPTGVGKSELAINLALKYNGEIISGDSVQVYKHLNIGSAKVSVEDQRKVVHHLIDKYDLDVNYNVKSFQSEARALIDDISSRNKLPIIVGGTGLYINAVLKNYIFIDEKKDEVLEAKLKELSNQELYDLLLQLDKEAALKLHVNNRVRLIRAITIAKSSDYKKSDLEKLNQDELLYDGLILFLTKDRKVLYEKINQRVLKMIDLGLEDEIQFIVDNYPDAFNLPAMSGIGYKEWKPYFLGQATIDEVIAQIQKKSRNYAKRQYTWFRNQIAAKWINKDLKDYLEIVYNKVEDWLKVNE